MIKYSVESFGDVIGEVGSLLVRHWEEIALDQDTVPLDPDYDSYRRLADLGKLHITTARSNGVLVGYACFFLIQNLHYKSLFVADPDIFWLAPEHRKGSAGFRLLRFAEDRLAEIGVNRVLLRTKLGEKDLARLFDRLGYIPIERLHSKKVGL